MRTWITPTVEQEKAVLKGGHQVSLVSHKGIYDDEITKYIIV